MRSLTSLQIGGRRLFWVPFTLLGLITVIALSAMSACGGKSPEELVEERCVGCHALTIVETSQKTREEWEVTVLRMVERGARLNDRQAQEIIDYLSSTYGLDVP